MRILILGGTEEGFQLAERLAELPGLEFISSLAGRTKEPRMPRGAVRLGGFGGPEGLAHYLREERITHIINAAHPFAEHISANAVAAAEAVGIPLLRLLRPAWTARHDDHWVTVPDVAEAAELCRRVGGRILLTLGSSDLEAFAHIHNAHFVVRMIDVPERLPLRDYRTIAARGPFSLQGELRLLAEHHISLIVTKNSGGDATFAKIEAARKTGLPVVMIERPPIALDPRSPVVATVEDVIAWVQRGAG
ncbi:cobalt-precorrin-6A reductase [Dongia deserti]|uniref:cobalt-precorrin-6A reductase n=1 Tax=Dongia deserti TaxID=2268030 RepID=UPI0025470BC6|nr:cobalt-precorrin-6A reductase [Dongia deserti]